MNIEIIGTLASIIILISFLYSDEKKIRLTNIVGALLFVIYGIITDAFSVWFLNLSLIGIHVYKLVKLRKSNP